MISRICGRIKDRRENSLLIDVGGICYEVFIPVTIMKAVADSQKEDGSVELVTFHYHQLDPARAVPVLIGFLNEVEKDFFIQFITISGIGPKATVKALSLPISTIARAIDLGDLSTLESLPGIGPQRAREIIAKLQGKVGKFGLIKDEYIIEIPKIEEDVQSEALQVLLQLQYKRSEAQEMIRKAVEKNPDAKTAEDILNEVYKQKISKWRSLKNS